MIHCDHRKTPTNLWWTLSQNNFITSQRQTNLIKLKLCEYHQQRVLQYRSRRSRYTSCVCRVVTDWRESDGREPRRRGHIEAMERLLQQVRATHTHYCCGGEYQSSHTQLNTVSDEEKRAGDNRLSDTTESVQAQQPSLGSFDSFFCPCSHFRMWPERDHQQTNQLMN